MASGRTGHSARSNGTETSHRFNCQASRQKRHGHYCHPPTYGIFKCAASGAWESGMKKFMRLLCFDIKLHVRKLTEWASLVLFFLIVILLLPFAIGPDQDLLQRLAPGLIWLAALLMILL